MINPIMKTMKNMQTDKAFVDAVNAAMEQVRREFPRAKLEEVRHAIETGWTQDFIDIDEQIDEIDFNAMSDGSSGSGSRAWFDHQKCVKLRAALRHIATISKRIGGKVVPIGRNLIRYILNMVRRFPNFISGMIIMAMLCWFAAKIPFLGPVLVPMVMTIAVGVGLVMLFKDIIVQSAIPAPMISR